MNKDDKTYIKDQVQQLEKKLGKRIDKNTEQIQMNGIMIKNIQDIVQSIAESQSITNQRLDDLIYKFDNADTGRIDTLWKQAVNHEMRIHNLEKTKAI